MPQPYKHQPAARFTTQTCNPTLTQAQACTPRCESDHLSDFIVVSGPSSWDELIDSVLAVTFLNI